MGDNRYCSKDSRYWGVVPRENIRGRPLFVYYSYVPGPGRRRARAPGRSAIGRCSFDHRHSLVAHRTLGEVTLATLARRVTRLRHREACPPFSSHGHSSHRSRPRCPLAVIVRRAHAAAVAHLASDPGDARRARRSASFRRHSGTAGSRRRSRRFANGAPGYREGAEVNHGYGTSRLRSLGPDAAHASGPTQLDELDARAQRSINAAFASCASRDRVGARARGAAGTASRPHARRSPTRATSRSRCSRTSTTARRRPICATRRRSGRRRAVRSPASSRKPLPMLKVSER